MMPNHPWIRCCHSIRGFGNHSARLPSILDLFSLCYFTFAIVAIRIPHTNITLSFDYFSASTAGATSAMVTAVPPNGGGFITASFPSNVRSEKFTKKHLVAATSARASACSKHTQIPGYYATYNKPTSSNPDRRCIRPILIPTSCVNSSSGSSEEVYLFTVSNLATEAKLFTAPASEINGSTIRLVTSDFAKTLPTSFAMGTSFKPSTKKMKEITALKDMLPTAGTHVTTSSAPIRSRFQVGQHTLSRARWMMQWLIPSVT